MLIKNTTGQTQAAYDATRSVELHLRRHGAGLVQILDLLDDPSGMDAVLDLSEEFGKRFPDAGIVKASVDRIYQTLASQTPTSWAKMAREWNFHADAAARWHGARVSELLSKFRSGA